MESHNTTTHVSTRDYAAAPRAKGSKLALFLLPLLQGASVRMAQRRGQADGSQPSSSLALPLAVVKSIASSRSTGNLNLSGKGLIEESSFRLSMFVCRVMHTVVLCDAHTVAV